jgi:hypothetical protein
MAKLEDVLPHLKDGGLIETIDENSGVAIDTYKLTDGDLYFLSCGKKWTKSRLTLNHFLKNDNLAIVKKPKTYTGKASAFGTTKPYIMIFVEQHGEYNYTVTEVKE